MIQQIIYGVQVSKTVYIKTQQERIDLHYSKIVATVKRKGFFSNYVIGVSCPFKIFEKDLPIIKQRLIDDGVIVNNPKGWLCEAKRPENA